MTRIGQGARITLQGFDREGIDHNSPLEDQCVLVYRAARRYAEAQHFKKGNHAGHSGLIGPMTMKRITESLFPDTDQDHVERLNGLINQVLKKTVACVCIAHPEKRGDSPIWFVNDSMPHNIVVVALSHSKNKPPLAPVQDDWRERQEARLTPEEAGETLKPGPVQVSFVQPTDAPEATDRDKVFAETRDRKHAERIEYIETVYSLVAGQPVPISMPEALQLMGIDQHPTTIRGALFELYQHNRLFRRKETTDERLLRGGGQLPKGKAVDLYWPTEPVPERTALPDGVRLYQPAAVWSQENRDRLEAAMDTVLEVLSKPYPKGTNRPRSIGRITEAAGLPLSLVRQALEKLVDLELIYDNDHSNYFLSDRKRGPKSATLEAQEQDEEQEATDVPETPTAPPVPEVSDRSEIVEQFMALAEQLVSPGETAELVALREEVSHLKAENTKLRAAVKTLRDTVTSLTDL